MFPYFKVLFFLSLDPLHNIFPLLLKQTEFTSPLWPFNVAISFNVSIYHILIVLSAEALDRIVASLLNATHLTEFLCPYNIAILIKIKYLKL